MAGLLDFLSPALNAAAATTTAYGEGQDAIARARQAQVIQAIQLRQQQQKDALTAALQRAQLGNLQSETSLRQYQMDHPKPQPIDPLSPQGIAARTQMQHDQIDYSTQHGYHAPQHDTFQFVQGTDAQGNPIVLSGNTHTGALVPTGQHGRPVSSGRENVQNQMAQQHYANAVSASDALDRFGTTLQSHGPVMNWIMGHNPLDSNMQAANQAGDEFVTLVAPLLNRGRTTHVEMDAIRRAYVPQAGDNAQVIQQKAAKRKLLLQQFANEPSTSNNASAALSSLTTAQQQRAQADPEYAEYLREKGYQLP